jgi:GcrA cell cycle regulator
MKWTDQRTLVVTRMWSDGFTASLIAAELGGVTRNAVIGKMHRLGIPSQRAKPEIKNRAARRRTYRITVRKERQPPKLWSLPRLEDIPILDGRGCSLIELALGRCRWPINEPRSPDFCFCGSATFEAFPYCRGHAQLAYRPNRHR